MEHDEAPQATCRATDCPHTHSMQLHNLHVQLLWTLPCSGYCCFRHPHLLRGLSQQGGAGPEPVLPRPYKASALQGRHADWPEARAQALPCRRAVARLADACSSVAAEQLSDAAACCRTACCAELCVGQSKLSNSVRLCKEAWLVRAPDADKQGSDNSPLPAYSTHLDRDGKRA